jgi:O-methyltransferase
MIRQLVRRPIKMALRSAGYQLSPIDPPRSLREQNPDITDREWSIYCAVSPLTMLSMERILTNIRAVDHVVNTGIPGDIVECGVWRGGSSMAMALALQGRDIRNLWMYDTYAGMTEATEVDVNAQGLSASRLLSEAKQFEKAELSLVLAFASLEDVQNNMRSTGYNWDSLRFVQGPVEQTLPAIMPDKISVLRIDTDWYKSTRHELEHLYPRLSPGGILIIDDYGCWQGARKAVDEYFQGKNVFLNRIDYTGRLAVKPFGVTTSGHATELELLSQAVAGESIQLARP